MTFHLAKLPYSLGGLAPLISRETLEDHYDRQGTLYVDNLNRLTSGTPYAEATLTELIRNSQGSIYHYAAQIWNHELYWKSLTPLDQSGYVGDPFLYRVRKDYGSIEGLKRAIRECALAHFGSGWTWVVKNEAGGLRVVNSSNADNPLRLGLTPLLACDLWEHAYYIDYRNVRVKYVDAFLRLVNLSFASQRYGGQGTVTYSRMPMLEKGHL